MTAATLTNPLELRGQPPIEVDASEVHPDDVRHWSVTEVLKAIGDPGGLIHWSATEAAKAAVKSRATWQAMEQENGTQEAVEWIAKARFRTSEGRLSDAGFGNLIHELLEQYALTGVRPEPDPVAFGAEDITNATACLEQFDRWLNTFQPTYVATEAAVFSPLYGYAGTADAFLNIDGIRFLADYKSSRKSWTKKNQPTKPYADSVALQLAAYAGAELLAAWRARRFEKNSRRYYLLSEEERDQALAVPEVDAGLAIHITPEHCDAYPIPKLADLHPRFLHALEVARWVYQDSKRAMLPPLEAPAHTTNDDTGAA